ncbi:MAG: SDR family oxidoreductase [Pseudomonadales bacterium]|nr:SDR family oxidoreductase [Pseudomonadales bacterium]
MIAVAKQLEGKIALITGATSGIGRVAALELAAQGAELYLVCRSQIKAEAICKYICEHTGNEQIHILHWDLASLTDVRRIANEFIVLDKPLHILLNNAGVFNLKREITVDGHELMFAVNYLAHFLLTNLLLDRLKSSAQARIVNVASDAHMLTKSLQIHDLSFEDGFKALKVYSHSKLANILFTRELASRLGNSELTVNAIHPGTVATNLGAQNGWVGLILNKLMKIFLQSPEKGARTSIYACLSPDLNGVTGQYFANCRMHEPKPWAKDDVMAQQLWNASVKLTML